MLYAVITPGDGLPGEEGESLGGDLEEALAACLEGGDVVLGDEPVGRLVLAEGQQLLELEVVHRGLILRTDAGRGESYNFV